MNTLDTTPSMENLTLVVAGVLGNLRRERALSGRQLGDLIGISQQQISRYENGQCEIKIATLCSVLYHLNYSLEFFFDLVVTKLKKNNSPIYSYYQPVFKISSVERMNMASQKINPYFQ